jgi:septal ring factor EnvC (AmiA/AmiB activator)
MAFFELPFVADAVSIVLPLLIGWLVGHRQQRAQAQGNEIENVEKAIRIWRTMTEDLKQEMAGMKAELEATRAKNKELEEELESMRNDFEQMLKGCPNNCPAPTALKSNKRPNNHLKN